MGFWNFVFRGTPPGASSPPPPPVIAPPLSPKPPVAAACQVQIPASWEKTPPAHLKFLTQFLNGCVFVASGKWYWDQALGEPSATSVRRFIAAGLIVPASIASKLERHFNTKELQAFLRARNLPISGKKAAFVERLLAADPAWMEAKVADVTVYNCTPAGKHLAEQYIAAEEEKIRIAHERSLQFLHEGNPQSQGIVFGMKPGASKNLMGGSAATSRKYFCTTWRQAKGAVGKWHATAPKYTFDSAGTRPFRIGLAVRKTNPAFPGSLVDMSAMIAKTVHSTLNGAFSQSECAIAKATGP